MLNRSFNTGSIAWLEIYDRHWLALSPIKFFLGGQLSDGQEKAATSYFFEEPNGLLQQQMIIPIISIDKDGLDEATSLSLRRSSISSMASCTLSEFSNK